MVQYSSLLLSPCPRPCAPAQVAKKKNKNFRTLRAVFSLSVIPSWRFVQDEKITIINCRKLNLLYIAREQFFRRIIFYKIVQRRSFSFFNDSFIGFVGSITVCRREQCFDIMSYVQIRNEIDL